MLIASCNGTTTSKVAEKTDSIQSAAPATALGDTVASLSKNIMVVYQDKKNHYWFGSWKDGVYHYDGKTILHYTTSDGLSANRINEIKEDTFGNIYFNTSDGVDRFNGQTFTRLSVALNVIRQSEWKLEPNDLWFKWTKEPGHVYRYDGKILHCLTLPSTTIGDEFIRRSQHPITPGNAPYSVYSIYKDSKGNIWFGTALLGACRYNGKTFDWISEEDVTELHNGPANGVRSIIEDKDGYFWFNTMYRYEVYNSSAQKATFYSRHKSIGSLDSSQQSDLYEYLSIAKDNNNELWIATYRDGVWHYDGKKVSHYPVKDGTEEITLFYIYKDNTGTLWLGTHEHGAYKFNGKTFERFAP